MGREWVQGQPKVPGGMGGKGTSGMTDDEVRGILRREKEERKRIRKEEKKRVKKEKKRKKGGEG